MRTVLPYVWCGDGLITVDVLRYGTADGRRRRRRSRTLWHMNSPAVFWWNCLTLDVVVLENYRAVRCSTISDAVA